MRQSSTRKTINVKTINENRGQEGANISTELLLGGGGDDVVRGDFGYHCIHLLLFQQHHEQPYEMRQIQSQSLAAAALVLSQSSLLSVSCISSINSSIDHHSLQHQGQPQYHQHHHHKQQQLQKQLLLQNCSCCQSSMSSLLWFYGMDVFYGCLCLCVMLKEAGQKEI